MNRSIKLAQKQLEQETRVDFRSLPISPETKTDKRKKVEERAAWLKWYVLTDKERTAQGYPLTQQEYKKVLNISHETMINWGKVAQAEGIYPVKMRKPNKRRPLPEGQKEITPDDIEWARFMRQLTADAAEKGATAPTRTLYAQLKGKMPKTNLDIKIGLSADEIARRNLEATKQLKEGGY